MLGKVEKLLAQKKNAQHTMQVEENCMAEKKVLGRERKHSPSSNVHSRGALYSWATVINLLYIALHKLYRLLCSVEWAPRDFILIRQCPFPVGDGHVAVSETAPVSLKRVLKLPDPG